MIVVAWMLAVGCTRTERAYNCGGIVGVDAFRNCAAEEADQRQIDEAHQLTRTARSYALSGDCATVGKIGYRVQDLDPDTYRDVFLRDLTILKACFPAYLEAEMEREREATEARGRPSNPSNDPNKTWSFWCGTDRRCTADERACEGGCQEVSDVWCAVYKTDDKPGDQFVCGVSRDSCLRSKETMSGFDWGECVSRKAGLAKPIRPTRTAPARQTR
jgi:hypothetical protein